MVRQLAFACALAVGLALVLAAPCGAADEPDIVGKYKCEGKFNDNPYTGTVEISKRGESYQVTWVIGKDKDTGTGILDGHTFAVGYEGNNTGVCLYHIEKDGSKMVGKWVRTEGKGHIHHETLTKMK